LSARELDLELSARPENLIVVRQAVAGLGDALGLPPERTNDLKAAVSEACNNVILHAYGGENGALRIGARSDDERLEMVVSDRGRGFHPEAALEGERSLGLGLPLIAALSDSFEISAGPDEGTRMTMRFDLGDRGGAPVDTNGSKPPEALAMRITSGVARPVLARVIGALAARAEFSVDQLNDTVLLGDAVSSYPAGSFADGLLQVAIKDGDGTLDVRLGPLTEGAGERILAQLDIPEGGSLRSLARSIEVVTEPQDGGGTAEFLVFEVGG
jgi:serine/threonine-protein kinase RsbW